MFKNNSDSGDINTSDEVNSGNIFEDFAQDHSLNEELKNIESSQKRDIFFYFKKISFFLKLSNLLFFLLFSTFILYAFFQNNAVLTPYNYLSPVCRLFLGTVTPQDGSCYPVTSYLENIQTNYEKEKQEQILKVSQILGDVYEIENFIYSETVSFLLERKRNRLKPTEIIAEFDSIKSKFEPVDKSKIECYNIIITDKNQLSASCNAYSSDWDTDIVELENGIITKSDKGGTSLSVASSFINFINSYQDSKFYSVDRQKIFVSETVSGKGIFTKKTPFTLKLQYSSDENLTY